MEREEIFNLVSGKVDAPCYIRLKNKIEYPHVIFRKVIINFDDNFAKVYFNISHGKEDENIRIGEIQEIIFLEDN